MPRYFTVEQARATLPEVRSLIEAARRLKARADELSAGLSDVAAKTIGNGHLQADSAEAARPELERVLRELEEIVRRIEATGCLVKDLDLGLVDWPHLRDGHEVYLCWRLGEPDILYWHEISDGFRGRQPL
jgi:hypothetical protein